MALYLLLEDTGIDSVVLLAGTTIDDQLDDRFQRLVTASAPLLLYTAPMGPFVAAYQAQRRLLGGNRVALVAWLAAGGLLPGGAPSGPASGDLSGTYPGPLVDGLQGHPVSAAVPVLGQSLVYDGAQWAPTTPAGGGDVVGPAGAADNAVTRYDGVTGKLIQNSLVTISDPGSISLPALQTVDGRDVSVDGTALDAHIASVSNPHATTAAQVGAPPNARTITAGAGLTGGGDLSADRTIDVVANADGSITVNANDVQVGVLATDTQHGVRGGGTQHAAATTGVAGFLSTADKTRLDALAAALGFGNSSVAATTTTRYLSAWYEDSTAPTSPIGYRVTRAGTLRRLQIQHNTGAGNGNAIVYTVRVNGVASALTASIASTATTGQDNANTVAVVSGDRIDIEVTKAASVATSPTDILATLELT